MSFFRFLPTFGKSFFSYLLIFIFSLFSSFDVSEEPTYDAGDMMMSDVVVEVNEREKPAMVQARLEGETKGYTISNTYHYDMFSRDVVGMQGVPIAVESYGADGVPEELSLVFVYDDTKLDRREENLGILWLNWEDQWYETVTNFEIDYDKNEVTIPVERLGTYILEDMEIWESVWNGTYEYEEIIKEPECHWHNQFAYKDIEALADVSLYDESGEYHITTVEQLAGLVKLVNEGRSFQGDRFFLDADLDLDGYEWAPIGWYYPADNGYLWMDFPFEGQFFGNGHTISNLYINAPKQSNVGMFGRTLQSFCVHDLTLENCYVAGRFYVGGILGDNINSGARYDMTNCRVTGTVKGLKDVGMLVGSSASLRLKDCSAKAEEGNTTELVGDLRSGMMDNCYMEE